LPDCTCVFGGVGKARRWWLTHIILATEEAEIRRIVV
jgi:hypothetical protein